MRLLGSSVEFTTKNRDSVVLLHELERKAWRLEVRSERVEMLPD